MRFHLPLALSPFHTAFVKGMPFGACNRRMPQPVLTCTSVDVQLVTSVDGNSMEGSDAALLAGISAAFVVLKNVRKKRENYRRSMWVKDYLKSRNSRIMRDLEFNEDVLFMNFTRMSKTNFYTLLGIVKPMITKQNTHFRESVPAEMKLAITLRYLATGDSFMSLMYLFKLSKQFISSMLPGALKAIIASLQDFVCQVKFCIALFLKLQFFFAQ